MTDFDEIVTPTKQSPLLASAENTSFDMIMHAAELPSPPAKLAALDEVNVYSCQALNRDLAG
jgi:hypothetical protein